jgi:hypothetical protein
MGRPSKWATLYAYLAWTGRGEPESEPDENTEP